MQQFIKKIVHGLGWDLHRLSPAGNASAQVLAALKSVQVNLVFDIGANVGQFAQDLRSVGFSGKIVSFEPLSSAYVQLSKSAQSDANWYIHTRAAIGDYDGEIEINIAGNSMSSSLLPMLDAHSYAEVGSAYVGAEMTPLIRLDSIASTYLDAHSRFFIKIDTQGFEWQVLQGARETLKRAQGVLLELSLVPLYEGQKLWLEMIEWMESEGFTLWVILKGFTDPRTGRSLQIDAIFIRQRSPA